MAHNSSGGRAMVSFILALFLVPAALVMTFVAAIFSAIFKHKN